ncbi:MAG TPA: sulfatase-like hydrolase/transferase [Opitutaceae bacterium]|nr:sulfatase-like hydrolase/transferase [Opitutaceae bacterium]
MRAAFTLVSAIGRFALPALALLLAGLPSVLRAGPGALNRPNVVFILVDDLGVDWVHAYGADHPTPNLDRLASGGVRFETAWTSPICTPSRVMMLTGQYPGRTGWIEHYDVPRWGGAGLQPSRIETWPQLLHTNGYATAIAGKWQINDLRAPVDILQQHGFDHHCVWPGVEAGNPKSEKRYWDAFLQTDGVRRVHVGEYGPDITQRFALEFIRTNRDQPFLLYYPMILVHAPNEATPLNRDPPPANEDLRYAGSVTYMDRQVGELLDELSRLGLDSRTAVIFAGDNGSSSSGMMHGHRIPAGKGTLTQRGVQVPLIVRAPMLTPGGWATSELTDFSDIFPSLLELVGLQSPLHQAEDGKSWVPLLRRDTAYLPRRWIQAQRDLGRTIRDHRYKLNSDGRFFDLKTDPDERHPLNAADNPIWEASRDNLASVLASLPATGPAPFPEYSPNRMREYQRLHSKDKN